ncbi:hypothetical protein C9I98_13150 [Photobacterium sanctipauli]|uniref:Uncharacterized protein n=1 Tax=Photobacterium sanctipauli TaxID=1342794 RepID=A0A2T3NSS9_9GAMM|nr:hypothetical protein [Photobacterium sanctipauli]PSW19309.1 hypothetical protein C9I98_13150 [Photobacterium sanctipauli]
MTIGNINQNATYSPSSLKASAAAAKQAQGGQEADKPVVAQTTVSISEEAKLKQAEEVAQQSTQADGSTEKDSAGKAESFAYGALGMDHPDEVKENTDDFYTAGQVLSALGTVATVLLAIA